MQSITTPKTIQEFLLKNLALGDETLRSRIGLYLHNCVNLHQTVTESHLFLSFPRTGGTPDLQNIIISKNPEALDWTRLLFLHFQSGSVKADLNTF